jgi:hypothetical protein
VFWKYQIEGRVIPDWKKFISSGENIIRFLGDYIAKHIRQNSSLQEGSSLITGVLEISKNGQCLYYRNVLFHYVGIGPIGKDKTFSTVTSSRQFARTSSRLKTSLGFTVSPERHFSLVL